MMAHPVYATKVSTDWVSYVRFAAGFLGELLVVLMIVLLLPFVLVIVGELGQ
jgi:hypothetical protein